MKLRNFKIIMILSGILIVGSCKQQLDINKNPDALPSSFNLYPQLLTSAEVNLGFEAGSDLFRYTTQIMQMMSGQASQPNQTYEYGRYNITGSDENNVWSSIFATTLSDLELVINQATAAGSPHYAGVAKILKAYEFSLVVDTWGDVPYSEAQQLDLNTQPHYDDDDAIYPKLISLLTEAINDVSATTSILSPGTNSTFYTNGTFATARPFWIKLANTLKLRLLLHYSKKDPAFCVAQITALVNTAGITFMASNADNFQHLFFDVANQRSPISAFEVSRPNYLFADAKMLGIMNAKSDPRRAFYFSSFPLVTGFIPINLTTNATTSGTVLKFPSTTGVVVNVGVSGNNIPAGTIVTALTATDVTISNALTGSGAASGTIVNFAPNYIGVSATSLPAAPNNNYSRIHTFLRGAVTTAAVGTNSAVYSGAAPQRMISFAEYNFIRAEAALMGAPGNAQQFFTDGITASMQEAGVSAEDLAKYKALNGTLTGSNAQKLQQIIEEKYIALFGVSVEPWTDWRRTGYPALSVPSNVINSVSAVPHTLFYPQSEIDLNPNCPGQKSADLQNKVFWDQ